jgi:glycerol uptake facilitator-like aquaporin
MEAELAARSHPATWRVVVRAVISVVIGAVVAAWLFLAWVLFAFECGDNCGRGQAESWKYPGQFVLAAAGSLFAVWALVLSFKRRERAYHALVALSVGCAVIWAGWSMTGEF